MPLLRQARTLSEEWVARVHHLQNAVIVQRFGSGKGSLLVARVHHSQDAVIVHHSSVARVHWSWLVSRVHSCRRSWESQLVSGKGSLLVTVHHSQDAMIVHRCMNGKSSLLVTGVHYLQDAVIVHGCFNGKSSL